MSSTDRPSYIYIISKKPKLITRKNKVSGIYFKRGEKRVQTLSMGLLNGGYTRHQWPFD